MDVADPKDVAHSAREARRRESAKRSTLEAVMSRPSGRMWVYDLLAGCGIYRNPFATDAAITAFACGEMNVGQRLLADLMQYCPAQYMAMIGEENERRARGSDRADSDGSGYIDNAGDAESHDDYGT